MAAPISGSASGAGRSVQRTSLRRSVWAASAAAAMVVVLPASPIAEARDTSTVSAGYHHSCVVTADASVKCFGYNKNGELGLGDTANRGDGSGGMGDELGSVDLGTGAKVTAVSAGWQHTCALLEGGSVKCWGRNDWGQLGKGDYVDRGDDPLTMGDNLAAIDLGSAPSGIGTAVAKAVTTGQQFTCVLVEGGGVKCFGRNDEGQCGRGNLDENVGSNSEDLGDNLPYVDLGEGVEAISISSGTATTCAALLGGGIKCWGGNSYGGLGVGDTYNVGDEPTDMGDNVKEVDLGSGEVGHSVVLGLRHACAILVGGSVKCWGDNRSGQLGLGHVATMGDDPDELGDNLPFVDLGSGGTATSLSLGESHSCAVLGDGTVRCWGKGFRGQLGRGEYYARGKYPGEMGTGLEAVDLGTNVSATSLAAGNDHTCAALDDGSLKCWGMNVIGALGLGDTLDRGDGPGEMGDALPAVSLGTGVTVAVDTGAAPPPTEAPTTAPTPQATLQPTPQPTPQPSGVPVQAVVDESSPQPSPAPTLEPTAEPTEEPTPSPTAATREVETAEATGSGDEGFFSSKNITVAAYVAAPLLAFALLACFCARRRSRDSARTGTRDSWAKEAGAAGLGGWDGHASRGENGNAAVAGATEQDNGAPGSTKVFPAPSSISPRPGRKSSRTMMNTLDVEDMNLAGGLVVGGGTAATAAGASRENGNNKTRAKKFARCGSDTAFAVTSSEDLDNDAVGGGAARGGGESDSSGGAGTGRSSSPAGYDDDAAASAFDGGSIGQRMEEDDEMSENGWGSSYNARGERLSGGLPSYEEAQRSQSNRERNSEHTLARAAARAGRSGASRRSDADARSFSLR
eukprot:g6465.t1